MSNSPTFTQRDASNPAFWDERFEQQFMPWDKGGVPHAAQRYFSSVTHHSNQACLIPGCGTGYEAAFLAQLGWDVAAIDFSPAAVAAAKAAHPACADRFVEADFFQFQPAEPLAFIYERAFLCALPLHLRAQLAARWAQLLPAKSLLLGFFFITEATSKSGPPFSISQAELDGLLAPHFDCLENNPVDDSIPVFAGNERWQIWQKRD